MEQTKREVFKATALVAAAVEAPAAVGDHPVDHDGHDGRVACHFFYNHCCRGCAFWSGRRRLGGSHSPTPALVDSSSPRVASGPAGGSEVVDIVDIVDTATTTLLFFFSFY